MSPKENVGGDRENNHPRKDSSSHHIKTCTMSPLNKHLNDFFK